MVQEKVLRLLAPNQDDIRLVQLVAAHAELSDCLSVIPDQKELLLIDQNGKSLTGSNTICKHLASITTAGNELLGHNAEEQAVVRASLHFTFFPSCLCFKMLSQGWQ
jgi:hypothetical protein